MLWFGWFGFNSGSALGANLDAAIAFANTNLASATSMITWIFYDRFTNKKMSALGACIGAIVGLVAITPAAGFVTLGQSAIGFTASIISNIAIGITKKSKYRRHLRRFSLTWYWWYSRNGFNCCICK